jgi:hypothetical protein
LTNKFALHPEFSDASGNLRVQTAVSAEISAVKYDVVEKHHTGQIGAPRK